MTYCADCQQPTDDGYRCNACQEAFMARGPNRHVHGCDESYNAKRVMAGPRCTGGWLASVMGAGGPRYIGNIYEGDDGNDA